MLLSNFALLKWCFCTRIMRKLSVRKFFVNRIVNRRYNSDFAPRELTENCMAVGKGGTGGALRPLRLADFAYSKNWTHVERLGYKCNCSLIEENREGSLHLTSE